MRMSTCSRSRHRTHPDRCSVVCPWFTEESKLLTHTFWGSLSIFWGSSFFPCVYLGWPCTYVYVCGGQRSAWCFLTQGVSQGPETGWLGLVGYLASLRDFPVSTSLLMRSHMWATMTSFLHACQELKSGPWVCTEGTFPWAISLAIPL